MTSAEMLARLNAGKNTSAKPIEVPATTPISSDETVLASEAISDTPDRNDSHLIVKTDLVPVIPVPAVKVTVVDSVLAKLTEESTRILRQIQSILKEYGNQEPDIPMGHVYWSLLNQYRYLISQKRDRINSPELV